ncbi:uncharacterized protein SAPINGB_P003489 [Magnusiomyces paraingens]|uniref:Endonuclease n=1 Tax=Magnusiomyces paraingens TaxID=2606893 RepID=A0A5E8BQH9_9ASCO|nr:uncharacterized protein SAPINGB_P003489 [Saprochaete ingens]VVT53271.1 unnamed protein product [Saprochaete ingens]
MSFFNPSLATGALFGAGLVSMFWGGSNSNNAPQVPVGGGAVPVGSAGSPFGGLPDKPPPGTTVFSVYDFLQPVSPSSGDGNPGSGLVPINASEFFARYGHPGPSSDLAVRDEFISFYDRRTRNPHYVVEHITAESLAFRASDGIDRKNSVFKEDPAVPDTFKSRLRDFFRSGYDRGHLAPAADAKFSQGAMDQTFFLTNMSPQVGDGFNRDYWAHFEDFCRRLTKEYESVRIVSGPLFLPKRGADGKMRVTYEVIGDGVAVPTHFYKIIVGERPLKTGRPSDVAIGAFVLPNERIDNKTPLKAFAVPVSAVERASGLQFFSKLPPNNRKELCQQVTCEIIVRDFSNSVKSLPAPK